MKYFTPGAGFTHRCTLDSRPAGSGSVSTPQRPVRPQRDQFRTGGVPVPGHTPQR